jgi:hypothetical protein
MTRNEDHTRPWNRKRPTIDSCGNLKAGNPNATASYIERSPGTGRKCSQPKTSGNVIATAARHPHMMSMCVRPRIRSRSKMKRLASTSVPTRRNHVPVLRSSQPRRKNACQPRRQ